MGRSHYACTHEVPWCGRHIECTTVCGTLGAAILGVPGHVIPDMSLCPPPWGALEVAGRPRAALDGLRGTAEGRWDPLLTAGGGLRPGEGTVQLSPGGSLASGRGVSLLDGVGVELEDGVGGALGCCEALQRLGGGEARTLWWVGEPPTGGGGSPAPQKPPPGSLNPSPLLWSSCLWWWSSAPSSQSCR